MLALSSLVLAATLLSTPTARAGTWQFTCTGSGDARYVVSSAYGGGTYVTQTWNRPSPSTGSFSSGGVGATTDYCSSLVAQITVTVTATWQPDTTLPSDPAPPSVWLCESSRVDWTYASSGILQDGFGDPAVNNQGTSGQTASTSPGTSTPPAHWTKVSVSGGTAKLPERTLSAEADSPTSYGNTCAAHIDDYSVTVHAQPYNFTQATPTTGNDGTGHSNGTYITRYTWGSTDGNLGDLSSCTEYEIVTYPGTQGTATSPTAYIPPNPPFDASWAYDTSTNPSTPQFPNPTENGGNATYGFATDVQAIHGFSPPYTTGGSFTGTQNFYFDDSATGEIGDKRVLMPGTVTMPISIIRTVGTLGSNNPTKWYYTVTKTPPASNPVVQYPLPGQ